MFPILGERRRPAGRRPVRRRAAEAVAGHGARHPARSCSASTSCRSAWRRRSSASSIDKVQRDPRRRARPSWSSSSRSTWRCLLASGPCSWRRARSASGARPPGCSTGPTSCARCSSAADDGQPGSARSRPRRSRVPPPWERPSRGVSSRPAASPSASAASARSTTSTSTIHPARSSASSATTAPARPRCSTALRLPARPTAGQVLLDGVDITDWPPHQRAVAEVGRSFQEALALPVAHGRGRRRGGARAAPRQPRPAGRRAAAAGVGRVRARRPPSGSTSSSS